MKLQVLVSAVNQDITALAERMHLQTDAVIVNQTDHFGYEEYQHNGRRIQCYEFQEKGVGLSRNNALMRAEGDIVLFSDEDIVYDRGYEQRILDAFKAHPEADLLLFNMRVGASRATYYTEAFHRVHLWNAGRYPTYSFAVRREKLHASHSTFSLVFGGGAGDHLFAVDERVVTVQGLLDGVVDFGVGSINAVVFVEVIGVHCVVMQGAGHLLHHRVHVQAAGRVRRARCEAVALGEVGGAGHGAGHLVPVSYTHLTLPTIEP